MFVAFWSFGFALAVPDANDPRWSCNLSLAIAGPIDRLIDQP
jgi:hypothetical protein